MIKVHTKGRDWIIDFKKGLVCSDKLKMTIKDFDYRFGFHFANKLKRGGELDE